MRILTLILTPFLFFSCVNQSTETPDSKNQQSMFSVKQTKIDGLKDILTKLQNGQTEYEFIGITSNGIDCIYFVYENGKFNLEFEAMSKDQIPYLEQLTEFANTNKFENNLITYNNQPSYQSDKPAPVLRIETNATIDEITNLGAKIQSEVFHNNDKTTYDIVP